MKATFAAIIHTLKPMRLKKRYEIHFASFSPIYVDETSMKNAVIRAKYQRLNEGLSTDVFLVRMWDPNIPSSSWQDLMYLEVNNEEAAIAAAQGATA